MRKFIFLLLSLGFLFFSFSPAQAQHHAPDNVSLYVASGYLFHIDYPNVITSQQLYFDIGTQLKLSNNFYFLVLYDAQLKSPFLGSNSEWNTGFKVQMSCIIPLF